MNTKTGKLTHQLTHTHFTSWKDFKVPSEGSMKGYQQVIKESANFIQQSFSKMSQNKQGEPERLLVHCKAGIGRTGTTIALINSVI